MKEVVTGDSDGGQNDDRYPIIRGKGSKKPPLFTQLKKEKEKGANPETDGKKGKGMNLFQCNFGSNERKPPEDNRR